MVGPEPLRPHFLDSSALVKLVVHEPSSEVLQPYFNSHSWFVTSPLCVAEALNVVKRKWSRHELTDQQYFAASWELLFSYREGGRIQLTRENLADPEVFFGARELSVRYGVDLADTLQLYLLIRGSLAAYCDGSRAVHISADTALTSAARAEGLLAWDCVHEPSPP
jgi:predicted nucleic acid-binding protein